MMIAFTLTLFAGPPVVALGSGNYGAEVVEAIQGSGLVKLNGTTVTEHLSVTGSLITKNASIGSLDVLGEANLTDTSIRHRSIVMGYLQAHQAKFEEALV
ncbi:MAG: hypothetical protein RL235_1066, partial [Chlamydiota bacterium]